MLLSLQQKHLSSCKPANALNDFEICFTTTQAEALLVYKLMASSLKLWMAFCKFKRLKQRLLKVDYSIFMIEDQA